MRCLALLLSAAVLLSGAVVALCAISNKSLSGVKLNRENEVAWQLLDRQLTLIDYIGVDQFIEAGQLEGRFGDRVSGSHGSGRSPDCDEVGPCRESQRASQEAETYAGSVGAADWNEPIASRKDGSRR